MKLNKWTKPESYFGEYWLEYYVFLDQHRDSDTLTQSNFQCALEQLGGESETTFIIRENHWAVGWVEWIAIHETDKKAIEIAENILESLNNYPVLDEDDHYEREWEYASKVWNNCFNLKERVELCQEYNVSIFAARHGYIPEDDGSLYQYLTSN